MVVFCPLHCVQVRRQGNPDPLFEWGWRAVGLCSPCLWWWGRLCRRRCAAGGCARAVLVGEVSLGGILITNHHRRSCDSAGRRKRTESEPRRSESGADQALSSGHASWDSA